MNTPAAAPPATQRIVKVRRDYNSWVASETLEDYALRYTPQRFRRWSEWRVANTAFGVASFLILEAVGATLLVQYGWVNALWAILAAGGVIFLAGCPISVYAARYGVDMDLLTRGAGFGYIGSTLTSLIYASFTFIFFALEAAVMAYALELAMGIPPAWGYFVCAVVVIPLVTHGVSVISRFQVWTQPLWLVMMVVPYVAVMWLDPGALSRVVHYAGESGVGGAFDWHLFGAALTVGLALITQMGEQADYLRFMPPEQAGQRGRWWLGVLAGGPGWVVPGVLKMIGGALLAHLALQHMVPAERAVDPNQMYLAAYEYLLPYGWAVAATALFVVVSQLKINVTNAYAGSLAWSNFFSRLTHHHPGRVVWVVFNTAIAFMLMEMNVFQALGDVLGLYANVAMAWIMAVVADLVINKPMGWSPQGIEFKRAHLYDVNPVGVGSMVAASALGIVAHLGLLGPGWQAFSAMVAMATAFVVSPLLAWWTRGRYYLARSPAVDDVPTGDTPDAGRRWTLQPVGADRGPLRLQRCVVCESEYEAPDMAHCPAYQGFICSLCCTLDARCGDACKPHARLSAQWTAVLRRLTPRRWWPQLDAGLAHYLLLMLVMAPVLAAVLGLLYRQGLQSALADGAGLVTAWGGDTPATLQALLRTGYLKVYAVLLMVSAVVAWWLVLAHRSREVAQEESNRQTRLLMQEIESHQRTDEQLQRAKLVADKARAAADQANQAKTRYVSNISHELRTPLNSILGYAQLLQEDAQMPAHRAHAIRVILRGGEHLLSLIEGTLDLARIEAGKLALDVKPLDLKALLEEVAGMFELQAQAKGLRFVFQAPALWPQAVRADDKRLRQILINLLGNAVKFTSQGEVRLNVSYGREMAVFEVADTGPGMTAQELDKVFEPFARGAASGAGGMGSATGAGLGLTIARMLTNLMGGEMTAHSQPGQGTTFRLRLFLPEVHGEAGGATPASAVAVSGYGGRRRTVLVVDNEEADRHLLLSWLEPLGFDVVLATHGEDALQCLRAGVRPDALFMDLAMPGMDGWETLVRIRALARAEGWPALPAWAVVSANAFDKGLGNPVGLPAEDFFVKPVRRAELLRWLGQRLQLDWLAVAPDAAPATRAAAPAPLCLPRWAPTDLAALLELARLGYYRGFIRRLDALTPGPEADPLRALARGFRFDAIEHLLQEALDATEPPGD
ncbi:ATP-binding protein [Aquabacterium sp. A08]|uniref:hybrid sensor histidine kinase/response regulator n=1 Tax=Aquabacterium sp. A08 TaxID=2718532 RepID=UPI0035303BC5